MTTITTPAEDLIKLGAAQRISEATDIPVSYGKP